MIGQRRSRREKAAGRAVQRALPPPLAVAIIPALLLFATAAVLLHGLAGASDGGGGGGGAGPLPPPSLRANSNDGYEVNRHVVAFYYPWYRTAAHDGAYRHWNHELLPHWTEEVNRRYGLPGPRHDPATNGVGDLGSTYHPLRGPYSSLDASVVRDQMSQLRRAGVGSIAVSWYPPGTLDEHQPAAERLDFDGMVPALLDEAAAAGLSVSLHVEPYGGRNASNAMEAMLEAARTHGRHPAYRRIDGRPVFYVYDSYRTDAAEWGEAIRSSSSVRLRSSSRRGGGLRPPHREEDGGRPYLYMLWVEREHESYLDAGGFDGAYTYFASEGTVWGSAPSHWKFMAESCRSRRKGFSVSVGPGYDDTAVRPWNGAATKDREGGAYYERMVRAAMGSGCDEISITSWNEWHEGTQIEPAAGDVPTAGIRRRRQQQQGDDKTFPSYEGGPYMYVDLTRLLLREWRPGG